MPSLCVSVCATGGMWLAIKTKVGLFTRKIAALLDFERESQSESQHLFCVFMCTRAIATIAHTQHSTLS
jgi:hypothetical protein